MTVVTRTRQIISPNIDIGARPGWCLQYVDDGVDAPLRQERAIYSYNVEAHNGNIRTGDLPVGVRVSGFLNFTSGAYVDYGHVFWILQREDGSLQIDDSEVHSGSRGAYGSIAELLAWFGAYAPDYLGYSLWLDGAQVAEEYDEVVPATTPDVPAVDHTATEPAGEYTVKEGDTLGQIILDQGWGTANTLWGDNGDVARVAAANDISDPDLLHIGDVIRKA
jgi:hypothetical protein